MNATPEDLERATARAKSYTGAAIVTFILYWLFWLPGFIVNVMYYQESKRMQAIAGQSLPGAGCLAIQLWLSIVFLVGLVVIVMAMIAVE